MHGIGLCVTLTAVMKKTMHDCSLQDKCCSCFIHILSLTIATAVVPVTELICCCNAPSHNVIKNLPL